MIRLAQLCRRLLHPLVGERRANDAVSYAYATLTLLYYSLQSQYSRALLGLFWLLITPFLFLAVYLPIIGTLEIEGAEAVVGSGKFAFPIYVIFGFLTYTSFSEGFANGAASLVANPGVLQHSPIPLSILPLVKVLSALVAFTISSSLMIVFLIAVGDFPGLSLLLLPPTLLLFGLFLLGTSPLLSGIAVIFRDLLQVVSTLLLIEFFAAPIFYLPNSMSGLTQVVVDLNPLTPFLGLVRATFMKDYAFVWRDLGFAAGWACFVMVAGIIVFRRLEQRLADYA